MNRKFMIWWLIFVIQCALLGVAYYYEAHLFFWTNDITYISSGILALFFLTSFGTGYNTYRGKESTDAYWFIADSKMSLGMIGTVTGFIFMLVATFNNLDPSNIDSMKDAISNMATGMSTALLTTLAGLLGSLAVKLQLVNQDA